MNKKLLVFYKNADFARLCCKYFPSNAEILFFTDLNQFFTELRIQKNAQIFVEKDFSKINKILYEEFLEKLKENEHELLYFERKIQFSKKESEKNLSLKELKENHGLLNRNFINAEKVIFSNLVGFSDKIQKLRKEIFIASKNEIPVLLTGENGSGKSFVANLIHTLSKRADNDFIAENVAAIPKNLAESEIFGNEKGAFTNAEASRKGFFERADKSTLFLDEIGELDFSLQAKFLQVIQTGIVRKIGSEKPKKVDVRMIYATNCDLKQKVKDGLFRKDLFFRINGYEIKIPPLRERKSDIIHLSENHFAKKNADFLLSPGAVKKLESHNWPGNIRELEFVLDRAIFNAKGKVIGPDLIDLFAQDLPF